MSHMDQPDVTYRCLCGLETMPVEWDGDRQKVRARARRRMGLWAIVSMCMVCLFLYLKVITHRQALESAPADCPKRWHGGSKSHAGSCWCGWDGYCMCTPSLAIDTVVEVSDHVTGEVGSVLVVQRRDNGKLACIGGFVEVGETLEEATRREVREETGLEVTSLEMLPRVYDDPGRDARRHTVSVAYVARTKGVPRAGSDAAAVVSIPLAALRGKLGDFAFDHGQILSDYLARAEAATVVKTGPPLPPRYGGGSIGGVGGSGSAGGGGGVDVVGGGGGSSSGGGGGGNSDGSGSGRGGAESGGSVLGAGRKQQPVITGATQLRAPPAR